MVARDLLLERRGQVEAVDDGRDEGDDVEQGRDAVDLGEFLVQDGHLLGVGRGVVAPLAVFLLCRPGARTQKRQNVVSRPKNDRAQLRQR